VNVTSTAANGLYKMSQSITIKVQFSKGISVSGTPRLLLETGLVDRSISCTFASGDTANFSYTVQEGDVSGDLEYASSAALTLPTGAAIRDAVGNDADLSLPQPYSPGSLGFNKGLVIDGVRPYPIDVTSSAPDGPYNAGRQIPILVTFSEPVNVTGTPQLELETGAVDRKANCASGSGTTVLTFNYLVQPGDSSADLDYKAANSLTGTIRDIAGNLFWPALPAPGSPGSLGRNKNLLILSSDGSIAVVKGLLDGSPALLGGKVLYLKWPSFGYIEEPGRWNGIRVEGAISGNEGDVVCLSGTMRAASSGERYIQLDHMNPYGALALRPLGANQRDLRCRLTDG